jgi:hypothetical protein
MRRQFCDCDEAEVQAALKVQAALEKQGVVEVKHLGLLAFNNESTSTLVNKFGAKLCLKQ